MGEHLGSEDFLRGQLAALESIGAGADLHESLRLLGQLAHEHFPGMSVRVYLRDRTNGCLNLASAKHLVQGQVASGSAGTVVVAASHKVIDANAPVIVGDVAADPVLGPMAATDRHAPCALWAMPLPDGRGAALGTFVLGGAVPGMPTPTQRSMLQILAQLAAFPVRRDRLRADVLEGQVQLRQFADRVTGKEDDRTDTEARLRRITRLYAALSQCNQAIMHSPDVQGLLDKVCHLAVEFGGMRMAWVGMRDEQSRTLRPVACYGSGAEYLDGIEVSVDATRPTGQGPGGRAFRERGPVWCQDFMNDASLAAWHARGARFAWSSIAALPLFRRGAVVGVFFLYSHRLNAFDQQEQSLLTEMAADISFGLDYFQDANERRLAEERVEYLANFDELTGLPNRMQLRQRFNYAASLARRNTSELSLMFIDLDRFKNINDTLGHDVGDAVLQEVGRRLKSLLREEDVVCRLGGDEFIVMVSGACSRASANVAGKLLNALAVPLVIGEHELLVTASIGIAVYPGDGADLDVLSRNADMAMYLAKQEGRACFRFFARDLQVRAERTTTLVNELRLAIANDQLELHYQPQFSSGRIIGAEALLRWHHPVLGTVSPAEFIPAAEESGLILAIGEWVLRNVVLQLKAWIDQGRQPIIVAVNISPVQFRDSRFYDSVVQVLQESGLPPTWLEFELTEGAAMLDPDRAARTIESLHGLGVRVLIDDFGTGYSSLSYLKRFKIHKLKIDQAFVRDIMTDMEDRAIISAIISMAASLGMTTIAEGVETRDQCDFLKASGCSEMQGYYFSAPLPAAAFGQFVDAWMVNHACEQGLQ